MRMGSQVIFGKDGMVTKAFDISNRSSVAADPRAERMLEMIGGMGGQFSLDTLLKIVSGGKLTNVTPLVNSDARISEDLVVFDSKLSDTQWMRIWALRESKLPIHIRIWGSRDGYCLDAFITYSNKQPDEFFDPDAFEQVFRQQSENNKSNIAYAFLTDPGGEDITPKDMFKKSGYHLPVIKQAGITKEGAFWVIAEKSRNRMPNGYEIYGFSQLEDDLGRTYFSIGGGYGLDGETSRDIFVPIDFPFDERRPNRVTLTCDTRKFNINNPELIGTVDLTEWEKDAPYPNDGHGMSSIGSWKIGLAYKLFADEYTDKLSRLLKTIPNWSEQPENTSILFLWMRVANHNKDYEEAVKIGRILIPLLFKNPKQESRYNFDEYLTALARTGRIDEAAELFSRIAAEDNFSPKKSNMEFYEQFLCFAAEQLAMSTDLEPEQISKIMGIDITKRQGYENASRRAKSNATNNKHREVAEKRRSEIANYYQSHLLPEKMELLERPDNERIYFINASNSLPGHEEYKIQPINGKIRGLVSSLRYIDNIQPYELVPMLVEDVNIEQELNYDLIYKEGIRQLEQTEFVLNHFGLKLVIEEGPSRKVLVAKYNGQPLKNYRDVKVPSLYDDTKESRAGMLASMTSSGYRMTDLLHDLATQQNMEIEKDDEKMVIFNETGLDFEHGPVSDKTAFWPGAEGLELAKKWFEEQFGVTFTEEIRPMKIYIIRKRTE